jgi:MoaA/NifB/PqqE/SkfB family radical SAM enzyme
VKKDDFKRALDNNIMWLFRKLALLSLSFPSYIPFTVRMIFHQLKGIELRKRCELESIEVPPVIITSVTNRCNLMCKGCYNKIRDVGSGKGLSRETFVKLLTEARDIGSRIVFISGGEPMTRPELLDIAADFPEILFPLFTNGFMIGEEEIRSWKKRKNIVPIVSLEGGENDTDVRRGIGAYKRVNEISLMIKRAGIIFGHSMTAAGSNYELLTEPSFIKELYRKGARIFIFVEYQDVEGIKASASMSLKDTINFRERVGRLRRSLPGIFIDLPGEEEEYGGCLSAGRGFVHVSADGSLEPCPFSPYSDSNIINSGLKDALKSSFLRRIREHHLELTEIYGCALLEKRDWVKSLVRQEV